MAKKRLDAGRQPSQTDEHYVMEAFLDFREMIKLLLLGEGVSLQD